MKKKLFPLFGIALAAITVCLLFLGCTNPASGPSEPPDPPTPGVVDDPVVGTMTKETATKIFQWNPVPDTDGVEIIKFLDSDALLQYLNLESPDRAALSDKPLIIKEIDGKPVIRIRTGAFTPNPENREKTDISLVVTEVVFPPTLDTLEPDLFKDISDPAAITVTIPQEAIDNIQVPEGKDIDEVLAESLGEIEYEVVDSASPGPGDPGEPPSDPPSTPPSSPPSGGGSGGSGGSGGNPTVDAVVNIPAIPGVTSLDADGITRIGATSIDTTEYSGTIVWNYNFGPNDEFLPDTRYVATITLTPKTNYTLSGIVQDFFTVDGADASNTANSGLVTAVFSGVRADDVATINTAVAAAKEHGGGATIYLSPAFYTSANTAGNQIVVDASSTVNDTLYTIKGTGKNSADILTVGILLANSNVTLDGVKFNIIDSTRAAITYWIYYAGVSVARSTDGVTIAGSQNNVTVTNCNIEFHGTANFTSGIFCSNGNPQNITFSDNDINVVGAGGLATQAIALARYNSSVRITGNNLNSSNTATTNSHDAPAGALYMTINPDNISNGDQPEITGNTLHGTYDFYINILSFGNRNPIGFADKNFGTADSTWVTDGGTGFYNRLIASILGQTANNGYGTLYLYIDGAAGSSGPSVLESYVLDNNHEITAIDFWGYTTDVSGYTTTEKRDRITVTGGVPDPASISSNQFHLNRTDLGTDL